MNAAVVGGSSSAVDDGSRGLTLRTSPAWGLAPEAARRWTFGIRPLGRLPTRSSAMRLSPTRAAPSTGGMSRSGLRYLLIAAAGCCLMGAVDVTVAAGEGCTNSRVFPNPWPTSPDSARAKHDLHMVCALVAGVDSKTAASLVRQGFERSLAETTLGIAQPDGYPPGSLYFDFRSQALNLAFEGRSAEQIERALFCSCLSRSVEDGENPGEAR